MMYFSFKIDSVLFVYAFLVKKQVYEILEHLQYPLLS